MTKVVSELTQELCKSHGCPVVTLQIKLVSCWISLLNNSSKQLLLMYRRKCKCKKAPSNTIRKDAALLFLKPCQRDTTDTAGIHLLKHSKDAYEQCATGALWKQGGYYFACVNSNNYLRGKEKLNLPQEKNGNVI